MWNHNIQFHNYLLRQLPNEINRSLDIGCGLGLFAAKLSQRCNVVDAIDADREILIEASNQSLTTNITYHYADFLEADLPQGSYDVISSIASLHHMDLEAALNRMRYLLRPSGKLLILGLYREETIIDYLYSLISVPLNFIYLIWHSEAAPNQEKVAPTRPAQQSLRQIKATADAVIPGARIRRHLFWRYSLIWQKP